jgi:hypothetical protein
MANTDTTTSDRPVDADAWRLASFKERYGLTGEPPAVTLKTPYTLPIGSRCGMRACGGDTTGRWFVKNKSPGILSGLFA